MARIMYVNEAAKTSDIQLPSLQVEPLVYGQTYEVPHDLALKLLQTNHWAMLPEPKPNKSAISLRSIKGIGVRVEDALRSRGITTIEHLLAMSAADIDMALDGALNYVTEETIVGWQNAARILTEG